MSFEDNAVNSDPSNEVNRNKSQNQCQQEAEQSEEVRHFRWMKQRFTECFGLPTDTYIRRNLISFDGVSLAKGYSQVVATWQGLFFELRDEDINFKDLEPGFNTAQGCSTLSTKGVRIFKLAARTHDLDLGPNALLSYPVVTEKRLVTH